MQLQTVRPNIVQSIRAYRVDDLMQAAQTAGQHFLYANLTTAQTKRMCSKASPMPSRVPAHFVQEPRCALRLHDRPGPQGRQPAGLVVVLEQLPITRVSIARRASAARRLSRCGRLLGRAQDTVQVLLFFSVARSQDNVLGAATEMAPSIADKPVKPPPRVQRTAASA